MIDEIVFQGVPLIVNAINENRYTIYEFMCFGGRYIYKNIDDDDNEDDEYHEICSKQIDETFKNFFCKMGILIGSLVVALIWPTHELILHGIKTTALQVKLPFVEEKSNAEFMGNLLFQFIFLGHGFLGYIGLEVGIDAATDVIQITHKILEYRLRKMNDQCKEKSLNDSQLFSVFRNVVQQIRDHDKYCSIYHLNETSFYKTILLFRLLQICDLSEGNVLLSLFSDTNRIHLRNWNVYFLSICGMFFSHSIEIISFA